MPASISLDLYNSIRSTIKTGDLVAFADDTMLSRMIRWTTKAPYSHVGIVVRADEDHVLLVESTTTVDIADDKLHRVVKGVQVHWLPTRLSAYVGEVWYVPLRKPLSADRVSIMESWLQEVHEQEVAYDYVQVFGLGLEELFGIGVLNSRNLSQLFCSELVTQALQLAGAVSESVNPSIITPGEVAQFDCYGSPMSLKPAALRAVSPRWLYVPEASPKLLSPTCT